MARARNIKPGFFTNDNLADINPLGRLLFIGLWTICDRAGRLEDRHRKIKAEVLPYDNCDVDALLSELEQHGFILRYTSGEDKYIQVLNFNKHQNPHVKESESTIPAPDMYGANAIQDQNEHTTNPADSLLLNPDTSNAASGPESEIPPVPAKPRKSTPVTLKAFIADCDSKGEPVISGYQALLTYAESVKLPEEMLQLCWDEFKSTYLPDGPRATKKYIDWRATFLNCVKGNWLKLWWIDNDGAYALTTSGKQAEMAHREAA